MERDFLGKREKGKKQHGFVCIYTKHGKPFENYLDKEEDNRSLVLPMTLMCMRYNGKIGFIGGNIESDEEIMDGVIREAYEEIGYEIRPERMNPLATFSDQQANIHSFAYEVTWEELLEILKGSYNALHFPAEVGGCFLQKMGSSITAYFENFLQNSFDGTAKEELLLLNELCCK